MKRSVTAAVAVLIVLSAPRMIEAQRDRLGMGEALGGAVVRGGAATQGPTVNTPAQLKMDGTVSATRLAPDIQAAVAFLLRWGRGQSTAPPSALAPADLPVSVNGERFALRDVRLILPVAQLERTASGVRVGRIAVATSKGIARGTAELAMTTIGDRRQVTAVSITTTTP